MKMSQRLRFLLIDHAKRQNTITYRELSARLDTDGGELGELLDEVCDWCLANNAPMLSSLAVRACGRERGLPGPGFWRKLNINLSGKQKRQEALRLQREVFDFYAEPECV